MNTTTSPTLARDSSNHDNAMLASPHRHRRRGVAVLLVALVAIFGSSLLAASQPVSASSATGGASACFRGSVGPMTNMSVYLDVWIGGRWSLGHASTLSDNRTGCATLYWTAAYHNYQVRLRMEGRDCSRWPCGGSYQGTSGVLWAGYGMGNLGTVFTKCWSGCVM